MTDFHVVNELPEWFLLLRNDSLVGAKDVQALFGYKHLNAVHDAVRKGALPKPDKQLTHTKTKSIWTKKTLLSEIMRRKAKAAGETELASSIKDNRNNTTVNVRPVMRPRLLAYNPLPAWYSGLRKNSKLSIDQVMEIFPYSSVKCLLAAVNHGYFPAMSSDGCWTKAIIDSEYKRRVDRRKRA